MQHYKQCLTLDSNHQAACMHLASLLAGQGEGVRAKKYYLHVLKIEPDSVSANYGLGMCL